MEVGKPKLRLILLFGPSQFGKSTFINNMLRFTESICPRAAVGDGRGESVTYAPCAYKLGSIRELFKKDRIGYDTVTLIDVPGIFDSRRFNNQEILNEIRMNLLQEASTSIDAVIAFESVSDDSLMINQTLKLATDLFGPLIVKSTVVLSTKWDLLSNPTRILKKQATLDKNLASLQLKCVKWTNVWKQPEEFKQKMSEQLSELGDRIAQISPYYMNEINNLMKRCDTIAREIQENDPDRYTNTEVSVQENIPEEYEDTMKVTVTEWEPLTQAEILEKAKLMMKVSKNIKTGFIIRPTGQFITKKKIVRFTERKERRVAPVKNGILQDDGEIEYFNTFLDPVEEEYKEEVTVVEEAPEKRMPLSFYVDSLQKELKPIPVVRDMQVKKVRTNQVTRIIPVNHERYHFEHYKQRALEYMQNEFRTNLARRLA